MSAFAKELRVMAADYWAAGDLLRAAAAHAHALKVEAILDDRNCERRPPVFARHFTVDKGARS